MRILIADDSLLSRRLLEETLRGWGFDVVSAADGAEAWRILSAPGAPAIAILDWMMPGHTGPEICSLVRQQGTEPYTYILLLTTRSHRMDVLAGMEAGADDYLTKPFDRHELKVRLRAGTRIIELQEQLLRTREELREQATRDHLTQVWNRSAVLEFLSRELARAERENSSVGVIVADLDHFKTINDNFGHGTGDIALQETARRMKTSLRPYDAVGRYGGEEFLIVLPGANLAETVWLAERMCAAIRNDHIEANGVCLRLTCSLGCTSVAGGRYTAEEVIHVADEALYSAKRAGRDGVVGLPMPKPGEPGARPIQPALSFVQTETD